VVSRRELEAPRIIPATARLDTKPPKASRQQRARQQRQIAAWRKAAKR
jgi:hypothetical protein